jgi:hypothetical protein
MIPPIGLEVKPLEVAAAGERGHAPIISPI